MNLTLRIKRKWFDQILSGSKTIEYRSVKPFYDKLFQDSGRYKTLTLFWTQDTSVAGRKLQCRIESVSRVPTPDWIARLNDGSLDIGPELYAIRVAPASCRLVQA